MRRPSCTAPIHFTAAKDRTFEVDSEQAQEAWTELALQGACDRNAKLEGSLIADSQSRNTRSR